MAKSLFINNVFQGLDNDGDPRANGFVYFYRAGTSSPKDVYSDSSFSTPLANPVPLDANGRAEIWMDGAYKVKVTDDDAFSNPITTDDVNIEIESAADEKVLLINGSFEFESEVAGLPDNWIVTESADGTIEVDATNQAHGFKSLKFTSIGSNGAGTSVSDKFNIMKGEPLDVNFIYKASAADTFNKVDFRWYDADSILLSSSNAYTNNSTNPTSFEERTGQVTAHASAVQSDILITGMDGAGATNVGSAWFDGMSARQGIHSINIISDLVGDVTGDVTGDLTGNAGTATAFETGRTISLTSDVTGTSAAFDGSSNLSFPVQIAAGVVGANEIASSAVHTAELNTSTGSQSTDTTVTFNLTGGDYIFMPKWYNSDGGSNYSYLTFGVTTNSTTAVTRMTLVEPDIKVAWCIWRYVAASPPYDLGDGDIPAFIYALVNNTTGKIEAVNMCQDPLWVFHGPTNTIPDGYDNGGAYQMLKSIPPEVAKLPYRERAIELIKINPKKTYITQAKKNADMDLFPHPWEGNDFAGKTIVLLDPVSDVVRDLVTLRNEGEDANQIIHDNYLTIGNSQLQRAAPKGVFVPSIKWK